MLRLLLISIPTILIACSSDRSRPVAPAGKATATTVPFATCSTRSTTRRKKRRTRQREKRRKRIVRQRGGTGSDRSIAFGQRLHADAASRRSPCMPPCITKATSPQRRCHYYRSNNGRLLPVTQKCRRSRFPRRLGTSAQSIELTVPTGEGSRAYFYGACVDSVSGESNTDNNCSSAVRITVSGQETPADTSQVVVEDDTLPEEGTQLEESPADTSQVAIESETETDVDFNIEIVFLNDFDSDKRDCASHVGNVFRRYR